VVLLGNYEDYLDIDAKAQLNSELSFFIVVWFSIFMVILMLNMLIALISESHGDVMKLEKQAERYEKLHLMIDSYRTNDWREFLKTLFPCFSQRRNQPEMRRSTNTEERDVSSLDDDSKKYCSFLRYEENINIEEAERIDAKKKIEDISMNLDKILIELTKSETSKL
jgi:hypothetical protein